MKKQKCLFVVVPAMLMACAGLSSCGGGSKYGTKLDLGKEADKTKLNTIIQKGEDAETTNLLSTIGLSANVNSFSGTGDINAYEDKALSHGGTEGTEGYNVRTLKNTGFSITNQKTAETTVPWWAMKAAAGLHTGSGGGSSTATTGNPVIFSDITVFNSYGEEIQALEAHVNDNDVSDYKTNIRIPVFKDGKPIVSLIYDGLNQPSSSNVQTIEFYDAETRTDIDGELPFSVKGFGDRSRGVSGQPANPLSESLTTLDFMALPDNYVISFECDNNYGTGGCFENYVNLNKVSINNGDRTIIGDYAFAGCANLKLQYCVNLFQTATEINDYAFASTNNLNSDWDDTIGSIGFDYLTKIGKRAFSYYAIDGVTYSNEASSFPCGNGGVFELYCPYLMAIGNSAFNGTNHDGQLNLYVNRNTKTDNPITNYSIHGFDGSNWQTIEQDAIPPESLDDEFEKGLFNYFLNSPFTEEEVEQQIREETYMNIVREREEEVSKNVNNSRNNLSKNAFNTSSSESPFENIPYLLSFPIVKEIPEYLTGEALGITWKNLKTDFYVQSGKNNNEHINFVITIENLKDFVSEVLTLFGDTAGIPFDGDGKLEAIVTTNDYGYINSLQLTVKGDNISFSTGAARAIRANDSNAKLLSMLTSGFSNSEEATPALQPINPFRKLFTGGVKFQGKLDLDVKLDVNHNYAESKNAIYYQSTTKDEKTEIKAREDSSYTLLGQEIGKKLITRGDNPSTIIRAAEPTAIYENNNYEAIVIPAYDETNKVFKDNLDWEKSYVAVNGVKISTLDTPEAEGIGDYTPSNPISNDYCSIFKPSKSYSVRLPDGDGKYKDYDVNALKVVMGRGYINRIKSTFGNDAVIQVVIGVK